MKKDTILQQQDDNDGLKKCKRNIGQREREREREGGILDFIKNNKKSFFCTGFKTTSLQVIIFNPNSTQDFGNQRNDIRTCFNLALNGFWVIV